MNQFFAAGGIVVVAFMLWALGKKPKIPLAKGFSGEFPIDQSSLVQPLDTIIQVETPVNHLQIPFTHPLTSRQKYELRSRLKKLILSSPNDRLIAIQIADDWGDSSVVPILKIGLRDMDRRIVIKSAKAITKFKHKSITNDKTRKLKRYPPNVFLMR